MPGLDREVIKKINWNKSVKNINTDTRSDFIISPHFDVIFQKNSQKLIERTTEKLKSGRYQPRLPITFSVLKGPFLTRPGSILEPSDRLVYQSLVELCLPKIEAQMDRSRAFSHIPSSEPDHLFEPAHEGWEKFQTKISSICKNNKYVLKADVANYFETIPHHPLINLLSGCSVDAEVVNLLEEFLLTLTQRNSYGIVQGIFPSDVLGNFYLSDFDGDCAAHDIPSGRYVDDIFAGFETEIDARRTLVRIIERLRQNGLSFNPSKTCIELSKNVLNEEQEIETLFDDVRDEIENEVDFLRASGYGFQGDWVNEDEEPDVLDIHLTATRALMEYARASESQVEKIHRFCLPILRGAGDQSAIVHAIKGFKEQPHLSRLYASYLTHFTKSQPELVTQLEDLIVQNGFFSDYQRMYVLSSILNCSNIDNKVVKVVYRWLESRLIGPETRAICAIFVAKFGTVHQKRSVRLWYENEPSEYVRSAILYSAQFFPTADKKSAKRAWSGQTEINAQISEVI